MIPRELYAVVTEVLVYVYRLEERGVRRRGDGNAHGLPAVAVRSWAVVLDAPRHRSLRSRYSLEGWEDGEANPGLQGIGGAVRAERPAGVRRGGRAERVRQRGRQRPLPALEPHRRPRATFV